MCTVFMCTVIIRNKSILVVDRETIRRSTSSACTCLSAETGPARFARLFGHLNLNVDICKRMRDHLP